MNRHVSEKKMFKKKLYITIKCPLSTFYVYIFLIKSQIMVSFAVSQHMQHTEKAAFLRSACIYVNSLNLQKPE